MKSQFLIAAPTSGSGKTTVARGLMALLTEKGYQVQPFKCGPDYIDTKFHEAVCHRKSVNLDTFMATPEHVRELFAHYGADADVGIVEGMMGLFDGYDRAKGSSAEVAKVLDIPVVLVVDAKSAAYSMAALLSGFIHFREDIRMAGIIFNKMRRKFKKKDNADTQAADTPAEGTGRGGIVTAADLLDDDSTENATDSSTGENAGSGKDAD
jgi:cobyrinic acid a,c-diamide synthase